MCFLKVLLALTFCFGRLFHGFTTLLVKKYLNLSVFGLILTSLKSFDLVELLHDVSVRRVEVVSGSYFSCKIL